MAWTVKFAILAWSKAHESTRRSLPVPRAVPSLFPSPPGERQGEGASQISTPRSRKFQSAGFTLVELLVVIGIIALLIAILLPVLARARAQANRAVCMSNIKQLYNGILMYCNDNKGYFPTAAWAASGGYTWYPEDWIHW